MPCVARAWGHNLHKFYKRRAQVPRTQILYIVRKHLSPKFSPVTRWPAVNRCEFVWSRIAHSDSSCQLRKQCQSGIVWSDAIICAARRLGSFMPVHLRGDNIGWELFRRGRQKDGRTALVGSLEASVGSGVESSVTTKAKADSVHPNAMNLQS